MKFRLDATHYLHDQILEAGTPVGDGEQYGFRFTADSKANTDHPVQAGDLMTPSVNMTPLDAEALAAFEAVYGQGKRPENDPMKAIPLTGAHDSPKAPPILPSRPGVPVAKPDPDLAKPKTFDPKALDTKPDPKDKDK